MKAFVVALSTLALTGLPMTGLPLAGTAFAETAAPPADDAGAQGAGLVDGAGALLGAEVKAASEASAEAGAKAGAKAEAATQAAAEAAANLARSTAEKASEAAKEAEEAARKAGAAAADAVDEALDRKANIAKPAAGAPTPDAQPATAAGAPAEGAGNPAEAVVAVPDVGPPAISEAEPGVLSSWITSRRIWTTNEPASTPWDDSALAESLTARPANWQEIAKVDDIVLDDDGQLVGYIADIGGFLGIGAKKVLLGTQAIHMIQIGSDRFYATNFTKAELEALPAFNPATVLK